MGSPARAPAVRRRRPGLKALVSILSTLAVLVLIGLGAFGLLLARLSQGPIALDGLSPRVIEALQQRFGNNYQFDLQHASLTRSEEGFSLSLQGMSVRDASGRPVIATPAAQLSVDPLSLLAGQLVPRRLEIRDADVRLSILPDGQLAISAGAKGEPGIPLSDALPGLPAQEPGSESGDRMRSDLQTTAGLSAPAPEAIPPAGFARASAAILAFIDLANRPDSPLGALDRFGISHGRLVIDDRLLNHNLVFDGVEFAIDKTEGNARISLVADGPSGRWGVKLTTGTDPGGERSLKAEVTDISFEEMALLAGWRKPGFILDTPISGRFETSFDAQGKLLRGKAHLAFGSGLFRPDDRDSEPVLIDEMTGDLRLDTDNNSLIAENWQYFSGETHFTGDGTIILPPTSDDGWKFSLATRPGGLVGAERPGEKPILVDRIEAGGTLAPGGRHLAVEVLKIQGPELDAEFSIDAEGGEAPRLALAGQAQNTSLPAMVRLWPSNIAVHARSWFLQHLVAGRLEKANVALDFDAAALDLIAHDQAAPEGSLHITLAVSGGAFTFLPGMPAIAGLEANGTITGHKVNLTARKGYIEASPGHRLDLPEGSFVIADTSLKPVAASLNARLTGSLETTAALLAVESLKPFANLPLDASMIKGQMDGRLAVDMRLGKPPQPEDTQVRLSATLTNFVAEKLVGKEKLDAATLTLTADKSGVKASGQGRMFGQPATVELKKSGSEAGEAIINLILDEAARTRLGWGNPALTGPVSARVAAKLGLVGQAQANVDVDFAKAGMDGLFPGFSKPAGRAAKASFQLSGDKDGTSLQQLVFEGGGASLRGTVELNGDGSLASGKFTQVKLTAGDDMRAELSKTPEGLKLVVRGNVLDARPFLGQLLNPPPDSKGGGDADLDLKVAQITGQNRQVLSGADIRFVRRGGMVRQFQLAGKFGPAAVSGSFGKDGQLNLQSDNAGAFLSFVDFYRRMEGGDLTLGLHFGNGRSDGQVLIHDFLLRDEPALKQLVNEGANVRDEASRSPNTKFDGGVVEFQKLQVYFIKSGGRIDLRDGIMYGPQIGTSLEGAVDFSRNFIDVKGTFVPAYGLNNIFARIPVIGLLLGGGAHEGLFAVNFRVSGPASGPTLNINPLSAIAPGFLRKIFGSGEIPASFQKPATVR